MTQNDDLFSGSENPFHNADDFLNDFTRVMVQSVSSGYIERDKQKSACGHKTKLYLNLGINPYGCPSEVLKYKKTLIHSKLHHYPEDHFNDLYEQIAERHSADIGSVVLSRGLDHMLLMITAAFLNPGERVLTMSPSFFLFDEYARLRGADPVSIELREEDLFDWTADTFSRYETLLKQHSPKLFFIANPNNPTGRLISLGELDRITALARATDTVVVVDEAYGEYTDGDSSPVSASELQKKHSNLIVLRTLSKGMGLADLRVGYAFVHPKWVAALNMHRAYFPFSLKVYSLAKFALQSHISQPFLQKTRGWLEETKKDLYSSLEAMEKIRYIPTLTNIIMIRHTDLTAGDLIDKLGRHGILVARVSRTEERARGYVRVTIGTAEDMRQFTGVLRGI